MGLSYFNIQGGKRLRGTIRISGAKNAALPIMAASILCEGEIILHDVPDVTDVRFLAELLIKLGVDVARREDGSMRLIVRDEMQSKAEYDIVRKMRASICVLGPLLAKRHTAQVAMPGGCAIGAYFLNTLILNSSMLIKSASSRSIQRPNSVSPRCMAIVASFAVSVPFSARSKMRPTYS